ncbi:hypothetical protein [Saccharolobus caldissimus]|uniref:CRISPR-associated protein Cmr3 n=1 Tax=Saccharolobus caldissimus TaxID=1702097 RepID=A0AAQ4CSB0_9CREN|nr:hypothetical protein [Saccharolobus caldissimus]BDB98691.1 hypothetical protein SACC_17080 [Saccharolobus caldissimus]
MIIRVTPLEPMFFRTYGEFTSYGISGPLPRITTFIGMVMWNLNVSITPKGDNWVEMYNYTTNEILGIKDIKGPIIEIEELGYQYVPFLIGGSLYLFNIEELPDDPLKESLKIKDKLLDYINKMMILNLEVDRRVLIEKQKNLPAINIRDKDIKEPNIYTVVMTSDNVFHKEYKEFYRINYVFYVNSEKEELFKKIDGKVVHFGGERRLAKITISDERLKNYDKKYTVILSPIYLFDGKNILEIYNYLITGKIVILSAGFNLITNRRNPIYRAISEGSTIKRDEIEKIRKFVFNGSYL